MFKGVKFIDLTHTITEDMPTWSGSCGFSYAVKKDYEEGIRILKYSLHASAGTHMDAPSHFYKEGMHIADFALEELIVPCCVIDVSKKRHEDLEVSPSDIEQYEKKYGKIPKGSCVVAFTGWQAFWKSVDKYRNVKEDGFMHFPTFSTNCAELLLDRDIAGIGIDTLSPDKANSSHPVHHLILGEGKYIVENLCQLDQMPPSGGYIFNLPMKIGVGAEACVRCLGAFCKGCNHDK